MRQPFMFAFGGDDAPRRRRARTTALLCFLFILTLATGASVARGDDADTSRTRLTADLFLDWEFVAAGQISPDGRQVIYTRRYADRQAWLNALVALA